MVAVQEHHRDKRWHDEDKAWMGSRAASWLPTASKESGGVGVLHRPHLPSRVVWEHPTGRATAVLLYTLIPHGFLFLSVYLRTGQCFWAQADIIADIVEYIGGEGRCFMICADWQCTPEDVRKSDLLTTLGAEIVSPGVPTCVSQQSREIDFAVISTSMLALLKKVQIDPTRITRPHTHLFGLSSVQWRSNSKCRCGYGPPPFLRIR
eukprot:3365884-Amphidinium_carterae.1